MVAPRRGAWIEISSGSMSVFWRLSVAPRRGAWIEISRVRNTVLPNLVAPRRGAWIEIMIRSKTFRQDASRSPQGSVD